MNINLTLIGQAIAFAFFVAFCMKFVWPPLINAISERQRKIADGLNAAEKAKADLADAQAQVKAELDAAKAQAAQLIEQANRRGAQLVEEARTQASAEVSVFVNKQKKLLIQKSILLVKNYVNKLLILQ